MSWFFSRNKDDINIRKPGDAVYLEGDTTIKISEPSDWGWLYQENNNNGESYTVVIKKDGENWPIVHKEYHGIDDMTDIQATDVRVDENELIRSVSAMIHIKKRTGSYYTDTKDFKRISITRFNHLKDQKDQGKIIDYNAAKLIDGTGYHPSIFLFMLGATSNGKSCWINALSNPDAIRRLGQHNIINLNPLGITPVVLLKPTDPNSIPPFKNFFLNRGEQEWPEVDIYIVDLGGEISNIKSEDEKQKLIRNTIQPHAAGIFVVRNEKWLLENEIKDSDPLNLIHDLSQNRKLKNKFCYILTCADRLKEVLESKEHYTALKTALKKINDVFAQETSPNGALVRELKSALTLPKIQQVLENIEQLENIKQADIKFILIELNKIFALEKFNEKLQGHKTLTDALKEFEEALKKEGENNIESALERIDKNLAFARIEDLLTQTYSDQKAELDKTLKNLNEASKSLKEVLALKNLVDILNSLNEVLNNDVLKLKDIIPEALKKLDKVLDSYANHPNLTSQSPIFKQTSCAPSDLKEMWQNWAVASNIMKKDPLVGDSPCFVVSCCSDIRDDTGQIVGIMRNQYNAELPLIYMVYRLLKI